MATDRTVHVIAGTVVAVTALASCFLLGLGLLGPGRLLAGGGAPAARVLGGYQSVRTVVLTGAMVWLLLARAWRPLRLLLILNALVQTGDAIVGAASGHPVAQTIGPLCFAAALACAAWRLYGPGGRSPEPPATPRAGTGRTPAARRAQGPDSLGRYDIASVTTRPVPAGRTGHSPRPSARVRWAGKDQLPASPRGRDPRRIALLMGAPRFRRRA